MFKLTAGQTRRSDSDAQVYNIAAQQTLFFDDYHNEPKLYEIAMTVRLGWIVNATRYCVSVYIIYIYVCVRKNNIT